MADKVFKLTNGVSFGARYTVLAADVTANEVVFSFSSQGSDTPVPYPLAASIIVTRANANVALGDSLITFPTDGKVRIGKGAGAFILAAGDIITVVAQRAVTVS